MTLVSEVAPMESGEDPKANESVTDPYAFPLPIVPVEGNPKVINPPRQRVDRAVYMGEVPEVDVWMQTASDNFDQGLPIEPEEEAEKFYRRGPDLSLFKNRYRFYKDAIKAPDGQLLSWEEHKEILLGAKDDPKKMEQAVNMSVGLVKMVVDRVIKKFGTNEIFDEDDLFQSGMEGLLHGLRRIEGRDDSKPASYLVPCIEGSLRTFIRTHKHVFTLPQHVADMVARYRRAQAELEKKIPRFHSLTLEEQEQQITKKAGLSDKEARAVLVTINAKKEPFSEEKIDPEPYEQTDPNRRIELEQLRHDISEILPGLSIREDLVLRLRFGILGESRFSDKNIIEEFIQESKVAAESMMERGSFESLYNFDLAQDDFDSYNPAEQLFLALIGKIPESWVEYIQNGSDDFSATTFENVGAILGVTRERIRQIEIKALRLLKRPSRSRITRAHLD
jgi:RNA polymerase sigma factor (sigma-70 family)